MIESNDRFDASFHALQIASTCVMIYFLQLQISLRGLAGMVGTICPSPLHSSMRVPVVREVHTNDCPILVHVVDE